MSEKNKKWIILGFVGFVVFLAVLGMAGVLPAPASFGGIIDGQ
jgi:hypothetical protein